MRNSSDAVTLHVEKSTDMDTYTYDNIAIMLDGKEVGTIGMVADENEPYLERIDIDEKYRNKGIGTDALRLVAEKYGEFLIAPDNEDAKRLYERYGEESNSDNAAYIDQGYGVYSIYSVPEGKGYMARRAAQESNIKFSKRQGSFSKALTSDEWKKYNNAMTSKVDAGLRINDHAMLVESEKGDYSYKLVIYDNTLPDNPISAVYAIVARQDPNAKRNFYERDVAEFITKAEDKYDNGRVLQRIYNSFNKHSGYVFGQYNPKSGRIHLYGRTVQSSTENIRQESVGSGVSERAGEAGSISDLGKVQYQLRIEDKNRLDILDKQETRLTADLKTLEKAYAEAIRAEYERSIKPSEETSRRAAEINRKAAKRKPTEQKREPPAVVLFFICSARECSLLYHSVPAAAVQAAPQGSPPAHRQGKRPFRSSSYTPSMP